VRGQRLNRELAINVFRNPTATNPIEPLSRELRETVHSGCSHAAQLVRADEFRKRDHLLLVRDTYAVNLCHWQEIPFLRSQQSDKTPTASPVVFEISDWQSVVQADLSLTQRLFALEFNS
jgi:hypothetical protein